MFNGVLFIYHFKLTAPPKAFLVHHKLVGLIRLHGEQTEET